MTDTDTQGVALEPKGREKALDVANELACDGGAPVREYVDGIIRAYLSAAQEGREAVAWRVKDFADGWILYHTEAAARRYAKGVGDAFIQPLYLYPAPAQPAAQVVKALEWREPTKATNGCWIAESPFGTYSVVNEGGWYACRDEVPRDFYFEWFGTDMSLDTLATAKAVAQADYERRILSALASPTDADAAGWVKDAEELILSSSQEKASIIYGPLSHEYLITLLVKRDAIIRAALTAAKAGEDGR